MIVEAAVDHLARGADDGTGAALVEQAELAVGLRRGELDDAERMHERDRHAIRADAEILPRTFGLRAPIAIGGDLDGTETVGLGAGRGASGLRACRFGHEHIHSAARNAARPLHVLLYIGSLAGRDGLAR